MFERRKGTAACIIAKEKAQRVNIKLSAFQGNSYAKCMYAKVLPEHCFIAFHLRKNVAVTEKQASDFL